MAPACAVCGLVSQPRHKPVRLEHLFGGIGVQRVQLALRHTSLSLANPGGTVACRSGGRRCYHVLRDVLLAVGAYKERDRQAAIGEVTALQATAGTCRLGIGLGIGSGFGLGYGFGLGLGRG